MNIEPLTIFATMINFVILYFALRHFLFKPVNEVLENRENEILTRINKTVEDEKKAEALRIANELEIKNAKTQGKTIVEEYKTKAEEIYSKIIEQANSDSEMALERGKKELQREVDKATADIKGQVVDLAVLLSTKALGETLDEAQHRKLIETCIAKVGI